MGVSIALFLRQQLCWHQHDDFFLIKVTNFHARQGFRKTRDGQIDILADQAFVERFIGPFQQAHLNVWIYRLKGRNFVRHDGMAPSEIDPDQQLSPLVVGQVVKFVPHGLIISINFRSIAEKDFPGIGELQGIAADD